jgi:hypothetical protein
MTESRVRVFLFGRLAFCLINTRQVSRSSRSMKAPSPSSRPVARCLRPEIVAIHMNTQIIKHSKSACRIEPKIGDSIDIRIPAKPADELGAISILQSQLPVLLQKAAEYCHKVDLASLDFVCEEAIEENIDIYKDLVIKYRTIPQVLSSLPRMIENRYLYDYQMIRKNGKIQESRIMLRENGTKVNIRDAKLKTIAFSFQDMIFGPQVFKVPPQIRGRKSADGVGS